MPNNTTLTEAIQTPVLSPTDTQRKPIKVSADMTREYIAGGGYAWTSQFWRSLPWVIDDLTADFGDDLYDRMGMDAQVASDTETWKLAVLADSVSYLPAKSKGEDGYDKALELSDFIKRCFDRLPEALDVTLKDMLSAFDGGNKCAEINKRLQETGKDSGKIVLDSIKVKPRHAVVYVVDVFMNVVGVLGLVPGDPAPLLLQTATDKEPPANLLPRKKVAILTYAKKDNDPRGRSALRAAYTPWLFKVQMLPEWLKNLSQFGGASIWGTTPENAELRAMTDSAGNVLVDSNNNVLMSNPVQQLYEGIIAYQNGSAGAFPFGTALNIEAPPGDGSPFTLAVDFANREISKVILGQALSTQEGQHQSRAASTVHDDIRSMRVAYGKTILAGMLNTDIIAPLIEMNFGAEYLELAPRATLTETEQQDRPTLWAAAARLQQSGFLDPSQYPEIDAILSLPPRSEEAIARAIERQNQPVTGALGAGGDDKGQDDDSVATDN